MRSRIWLGRVWLLLASSACAGNGNPASPSLDAGPDARVARDAARPRDAAPGRDAEPEVDAEVRPDVGRTLMTGPIGVTSGQAPVLVLGRDGFSPRVTPNRGAAESAGSLSGPLGLASDGTHLWVADAKNARVLGWTGFPDSAMDADLVVGQTSFTASTPGTSQTLLRSASGVFVSPLHLFVADPDNHRVLIWDNPPRTSGAPALLALGQATFTSAETGTGPANLDQPLGIWSDDVRVIVADGGGRVLIWNQLPGASGAPADVVLGQPGVGPASAATLSRPRDVVYLGGRLYVLDAGHNRILVWNGLPTASGAPAAYVIGQASMTSGAANAGEDGPCARGFSGARAILVAQDHLFVSDADNHRVLVYGPIPTATGASASAVLGQPGLAGKPPEGGPAAAQLGRPHGLALMGTVLFVADQDLNRIVGFDLGAR